jgi:hypothetical protein
MTYEYREVSGQIGGTQVTGGVRSIQESERSGAIPSRQDQREQSGSWQTCTDRRESERTCIIRNGELLAL